MARGRLTGVSVAAALAVALLTLGLSGCFSGAIAGAVIASSGSSSTTVDTSFPDAVPTELDVPPFATLVLSSAEVTIEREVAATSPTTTATTVSLTGFEVLSVQFPAGRGLSLSNRDAAQSVLAGDRLVVQVDADAPRTISFATAASTGSAVATALQSLVRALAPQQGGVSADAYALFSAAFDGGTGAYLCESGAAGAASAVAFPAGQGDALADATAARLGLGAANGGVELSGADAVSVVVLNRGTDAIPEGTFVDLYLSQDKVLQTAKDVLFDRVPTDAAIEVGQARRLVRRTGAAPPSRLLQQDVAPGSYFVLAHVNGSGGETALANNVAASRHRVEVYRPVDDPATPSVEAADPLDFVVTHTTCPIAALTGGELTTLVTVASLGAAVPAPVPVDVDLVLTADGVLDLAATPGFFDPAGARAGVHVRSTDLTRALTVRAVPGGGPISTALSGDTVTVTYDGVATVQSLIDALGSVPGALLDAYADGKGSPATDTVGALLAAAGTQEVAVPRSLLLSTTRVTFPAATAPLEERRFLVSGTLRSSAFRSGTLPLKAVPIVRIRPQVAGTTLPENARDNVRQAGSFVRVYDRQGATLDPTTGLTLPTLSPDDFRALGGVLGSVQASTIRQGQQRVFSFEVPSTGLTLDESQVLVTFGSLNFDAHLDLLDSGGNLVAQSDDSALGLAPLLHAPVVSAFGSRTFYLVVSSARIDEGDLSADAPETFELTITATSRGVDEDTLPRTTLADGVFGEVPQRFVEGEPRLAGKVLVPFTLDRARAEVVFVLAQRARVKLRSQPVFQVGFRVAITRFVQGAAAGPVAFRMDFDEALTEVIYRPTGTTLAPSHTLEAGTYRVLFESTSGVPDARDFRLEVDAEVLPDTAAASG